ncbi:MAG: FapA family protein [Desulfobacteraceae bacterium]|jgi:uncharacterized protein (DUF342 family)
MSNTTNLDSRFGDIAIELNLLTEAKLNRALVVQRCIFKRSKVHLPIGKVLKEMGVLTQDQADEILEIQKQKGVCPGDGETADSEEGANADYDFKGLQVTISKDKLSAHLNPTGKELNGVTLEAVKEFIENRGVIYGLIDDEALGRYLSLDPLPIEPFQIAQGLKPVPGHPPELVYHFDTDPLRIGTLLEDGTMDWKNRGEIPQVTENSVLAEKTGGDPGQPGRSVSDKEINPPRIREPQIKAGKGAKRSEDGLQIIATVSGTPSLGADGKIYVHGMLPIDGDIGVDTGNIEFEGYIEADGVVQSGYMVKGGGLHSAGIEDATVEVTDNVVSDGGIYGSTITAGGTLKASHLHNCTIQVLGDLVVEKEIIQCTIETNGRCLINDGKIIASKIDAKKGIQTREIGTEASKPAKLVVGVDHQYERDMKMHKAALADLEQQKIEAAGLMKQVQTRLNAVTSKLGKLAQEQDSFMVQKRQFEEQLQGVGPNAVKDEEESEMLRDLIAELDENSAAIGEKVQDLMAQDDKVRLELAGLSKALQQMDETIEEHKEQITVLEDTLKVDPGVPVIKVSGTVHAKTEVSGLYKNFIIPKTMSGVRIFETENTSGGKHQIKISKLR